jgi:hypothetical protein
MRSVPIDGTDISGHSSSNGTQHPGQSKRNGTTGISSMPLERSA